jgi:hypothetical protein
LAHAGDLLLALLAAQHILPAPSNGSEVGEHVMH